MDIKEATKQTTKYVTDGRKRGWWLLSIPALLISAWACKQMCIDTETTKLVLSLIGGGSMAGIIGQATADALTKGATSAYQQKLADKEADKTENEQK